MKASRTFNVTQTLAQGKSGELRGAALRRAIQVAEEFGIDAVAAELRQYLADFAKKRTAPAK
jgi:hypothetical protein